MLWVIIVVTLGMGIHESGLASTAVFTEDFERGMERWNELWTRDQDVGKAGIDDSLRHKGRASVKIEHTGQKDWALLPEFILDVRPGQIYQLACWVQVRGEGRTTLCVTTRAQDGEVMEWTFAGRTTGQTKGWRRLVSRFVVPGNVAKIRPRLIGFGPAQVWLDDFSLSQEGDVASLRSNAPDEVTIENPALRVTVRSPDGTLEVLDRRTNRTWTQKVLSPEVWVTGLKKDRKGLGVRLRLMHAASGMAIDGTLRLEPSSPEIVLSLSARGELATSLRYPHPFSTSSGARLIMPVNEGISYPVDDETIPTAWYHTYGGHGLCMGFFGLTRGEDGWMAILETPDDAAVRMDRLDGRLCLAPEWQSQKGKFGYERRLRYVFFDHGGYVALCKRYRHYAKDRGLFKSLEEKRANNPNVDLLIGAVNVWNWDFFGPDAVSLVKEMRSLGIERILWSHRQPPETVAAMNQLDGVLTSRYDIFQDLMDPALLKHLHGLHPDWTQEGWPDDLMIGPYGEWLRGWGVDGKDGKRYFCGVLCDRKAPAYARRRIRKELKTHPYRSRFIDTTTATHWRECYHKKHPVTRTESRKYKMKLLDVVSNEMSLVCGSETGHDAAVPYVHYFEGMLSLGPYRVHEAGRDMTAILEDVPEQISKFQVGEFYRLPLWELVFHDCVVSQWYWGDYNNKLPKVWAKRDLFNVLYGTGPMFMFTREGWKKNKGRFVKSYKSVCPTVRKVGYSEMVDHRILTEDRAVQETEFANGVVITVNFGKEPYRHSGGYIVDAMGYRVAEP